MKRDIIAGDRAPGHVPVRMCVICRQRFSKSELTRYVRIRNGSDKLVADLTGRAPGRGFYLCSDEACKVKMAAFGTARKKRRG